MGADAGVTGVGGVRVVGCRHKGLVGVAKGESSGSPEEEGCWRAKVIHNKVMLTTFTPTHTKLTAHPQ